MVRTLTILLVFVMAISEVFPQNNLFQRIGTLDGLSNNTVISIIQDKTGFIWFGTDDGLNRYDGFSFKTYKPDYRTKNNISHN